MDVLTNRYTNFKAFCNQILPDNEFVKMLQSTPLELFLHTIKTHNTDNKTVSEICDLIFEKAQIDKATLKQEDIDKFTRMAILINTKIHKALYDDNSITDEYPYTRGLFTDGWNSLAHFALGLQICELQTVR